MKIPAGTAAAAAAEAVWRREGIDHSNAFQAQFDAVKQLSEQRKHDAAIGALLAKREEFSSLSIGQFTDALKELVAAKKLFGATELIQELEKELIKAFSEKNWGRDASLTTTAEELLEVPSDQPK
jgi:hypothetical protein